MPSTLTYPGVYIEEIPSGVRTISGVATSVTAFVGYTPRGPVNQPLRIFNFGDYEREFGGLHRDSDVSYAVQQFFMNGGGDAYVVRTASGVATAAITLEEVGGTGALIVRASSPGAWGNTLRATVDYETSNPGSTFNLRVSRYDAATRTELEVEEHRNLSMNSRSPTYAPAVVNTASRLVRLERAPGLVFQATDRGYAATRRLAHGTVSLDPAVNRIIRGVVNGNREFELVLTGGAINNGNAGQVRNRMQNAINAAPDNLNDYLEAVRVDADGDEVNNNSGEWVRLRSKLVVGDPLTAPEFSSVEILPAPANDASALLGLGLSAGGVQREGAGFRRPVPSGTAGESVMHLMGTNVNGAFTINITDNTATGTDVLLADTAVPALPATAVGPALLTALETAIHAIPNPAAGRVTASFSGGALRLAMDDEFANTVVTMTGALASTLRMPAAAASGNNVQRYSVGVGVAAAAQAAPVPGLDGSPPSGGDLLGSFGGKTGIYALRDVDLFNILTIPGVHRLNDANATTAVLQSAIAFCEQERAFMVVDAPPDATLTTVEAWAVGVGKSRNAAVYFPWILAADPLDNFRLRPMPPSGAIAGVYARTDGSRGVWKAPAGTEATIAGAQGLAVVLTDMENGTLNPKGVNVLRRFPVFGNVVWGARTRAGADENTDEYKYIPIRRLALFIEETLYRNTQWVVFEPNDEPLWSQIRLNVGAFMNGLFRNGAFQGNTPAKAYLVKCDSETTTQYDIDRGIVNILVAFAPLKPAEFVVIQIQQKAQIPS
jgi:uncharacterized protein